MKVEAYAAHEAKGELKPFEYQMDPLEKDEVIIDVSHCGICHSDLSMLNNDWGMSAYPFVPGHEVVGKISQKGDNVHHLQIGQTVGLGWFSRSCMTCEDCMSGDHNLCVNSEMTIVGRFGGFANKVKAQSTWVIPIPEGINLRSAGPLFCGGITVFNPIIQSNLSGLHHVGVVGIGGLGHMALSFLNAWGCEVTAFSTSADKAEEANRLGAHNFVNIKEADALGKLANTFDLILVTSNVDLNWDAYINALKPKGRIHIVGAVGQVTYTHFPVLAGQKMLTGSPLGSPINTKRMLEFIQRHNIEPIIESFPLKTVNEAMEKLRSGSPRYRLVLEM